MKKTRDATAHLACKLWEGCTQLHYYRSIPRTNFLSLLPRDAKVAKAKTKSVRRAKSLGLSRSRLGNELSEDVKLEAEGGGSAAISGGQSTDTESTSFRLPSRLSSSRLPSRPTSSRLSSRAKDTGTPTYVKLTYFRTIENHKNLRNYVCHMCGKTCDRRHRLVR